MSNASHHSGHSHPHHPVVFNEFFELGLDETVSPFLTPNSRDWGANLTLKASLLAAFLLVLAFGLSFNPSATPLSHFILMLVYFLAGIPSLIESIEDLLNFEINIDVLMTLAAFSSVLIGSGLEGGLLLVLFSLSGSMEDLVESKAKDSISSLHKLSPTKANVIEEDGTLLERALPDISLNSKILVKSGQVVPLDGIVLDGTSSVNLVHLTGENIPVTKTIGDEVAAGGLNMEGALTLKVIRTSADSTLARIIQLVTQAQESRPILQRWFDKLSKNYAIAIISLSVLFALTFPFLLEIPFLGLDGSVYRALAFLIAASPCALIIAIPIAYLSAISACARQGILLKGGITLDALASCTAIAFDKTGTLTTGDLACEDMESLEDAAGSNKALALSIAYSMERNVVHPIAKAIIAFAQSRHTPLATLKEFKAIPGYGVEAIASTPGREVKAYIGHPEYIIPNLESSVGGKLGKRVREIQAEGELLTVMLLGTDLYLFRFHDTLRPKVKQTIQLLKNKWYWRVVMLTGDHETTAKRIAQAVGIDECHADLRPEDKLHFVSQLSQTRGLAMIGDGVNDAPALARATVGICMGKFGSAAAVDAADIILLHDTINLLDWLISKATQTQTIVKQNLVLAAGAILLASLPALAGIVPLWLAVVMHEGGTILVGLNGLRLLNR